MLSLASISVLRKLVVLFLSWTFPVISFLLPATIPEEAAKLSRFAQCWVPESVSGFNIL